MFELVCVVSAISLAVLPISAVVWILTKPKEPSG